MPPPEKATNNKVTIDKSTDKPTEVSDTPTNVPMTFSDYMVSLPEDEQQWDTYHFRALVKALKAARDPQQVFFNHRHGVCQQGVLKGKHLYYYTLNGVLYVASDEGPPWKVPMIPADPATVGLSYDDLGDMNDLGGFKLTVALDHEYLYNDTVYIKDFLVPLMPLTKSWANEVRVYERLARHHPHPNIVRYFGCRVNSHKRITGIVLERGGRCLADYDADAPAFRDLDVDMLLDRLEATVRFLHTVGLAHNDIKPANVLVHENGHPLLIDFESCAPPGASLSRQGTLGWVEPEHVNMVSRVENDLYALKMMRERIHDKTQVAKWFPSCRVMKFIND
ncbi:hypothetical protein SCUCBS95973_002314 [Sporothrix curviconia]|uniref:Protein kinase domain-containing protein n=1 Tax=Sporothrix curviconia TaxID=1260050 RepID=A0ABP0B5Z8_9PEZI